MIIRALFALADQEYEDCKIDFSNWAEYKQTLPFQQVPVLEITENSKTYTIAQSIAISRFLANKFGLAGKTDIEKAQVDMIVDELSDVLNLLTSIYKIPEGEDRIKALNKITGETIPNMLKFIENLLVKNENGFLVGDSLTFADLHLINTIEWLGDYKENILSKLDVLKEYDQRIRSLPKIAQHIKESSHIRHNPHSKT